MKDSHIGKGYSCFFSFLILILMLVQAVRVDFDFPKNQLPQIKDFEITEIPPHVATIEMLIIAYLLGCPTDKIAEKIAEKLGAKTKDEDD